MSINWLSPIPIMFKGMWHLSPMFPSHEAERWADGEMIWEADGTGHVVPNVERDPLFEADHQGYEGAEYDSLALPREIELPLFEADVADYRPLPRNKKPLKIIVPWDPEVDLPTGLTNITVTVAPASGATSETVQIGLVQVNMEYDPGEGTMTLTAGAGFSLPETWEPLDGGIFVGGGMDNQGLYWEFRGSVSVSVGDVTVLGAEYSHQFTINDWGPDEGGAVSIPYIVANRYNIEEARAAAMAPGTNPFGPNPVVDAINNQSRQTNIDNTRGPFNRAESTRSPLALDLDGDGIETMPSHSGVYFDHNGDGFAESTGWIAPDDGLLVWDRNANEIIDDGSELFGNYGLLSSGLAAANGFALLAELDANNDGSVDANDPAFAHLLIWQDADSDGYVREGELVSLSTYGVTSIGVGYAEQQFTDAYGNQHLQVGTYLGAGGQARAVHDVWFTVDTALTIDQNVAEVSNAIAGLPFLPGMGTVSSLHQVMARDTSGALQALVSEFVEETDPIARRGLVLDIIYHWAGVQDIDPESRSNSIYSNPIGDARKLHALEALLGDSYLGIWCWGALDPNPHASAAAILLTAFARLEEYVSTMLLSQTHLEHLYRSVVVVTETGALGVEVSATYDLLVDAYAADPDDALTQISAFGLGLNYFGLYGADVLAALRALGDANGSTFDAAIARIGERSALGDEGDNIIAAGNNADVLVGLAGDDTLYGEGGADRLLGGAGQDYLVGGSGADTYVFARGDGQDSINNFDNDVPGDDTLEFTVGIAPSDIALSRFNYDAVFSVIGTTDSITVLGFFDQGGASPFAIDRITFADGTIWTAGDILAEFSTPSPGDDFILGASGADVVDAVAGSDIVEGGAGDDSLVGGAGADWLYGGADDDVLDGSADNDFVYGGDGDDDVRGGAGNDFVEGGAGSDTYRFGRGFGQDTLNNYAGPGASAVDVIAFDLDVAPEDVVLRREGWNLVITIPATGDRLVVESHFAGADYALQRIDFANGVSWDGAGIQAQLLSGGPGADHLIGGAGDDTSDGRGGDDHIEGLDGDDTLSGGEGADRLDGGYGDDHLTGGAGADILVGSYGSDAYHFGVGAGQDVADNYAFPLFDTPGSVDVVVIDGVVAPDDVIVRRVTDHLVITIFGTDDRLTIPFHFTGSPIREIRFGDGTIWDSAEIEVRLGFGGPGDDVLVGSDGDNVLSGFAGNDVLTGNAGDDVLEGGVGDDQMTGGPGSDTYRFSLGDGQDIIFNTPSLFDPDPPDKIDAIVFGAGILPEDVVVRRSNITLVLTVGDDGDLLLVRHHFAPEEALQQIRFANGVVWSTNDINVLSMTGGPGNDSLIGGDGVDIANGFGGDDQIEGWAGDDQLNGGDGHDRLLGGNDNDLLAGGAGDDWLDGGPGADTVTYAAALAGVTVNLMLQGNPQATGGAGADRLIEIEHLRGSAFADVLTGDGGDNVLAGGAGADALNGGDGVDTADYSTSNGRVVVRLSTGLGESAHAQGDTLTAIENLIGSAFNDALIGSTTANALVGGMGNDYLDGGVANDVLTGGEGDDRLVGGIGADQLIGGAGIDLADYSTGTGRVVVRLWNGTGESGAAQGDVLSGIENITGTSANDALIGSSGANVLRGGAGADRLDGLEGNDHLVGGAGADTMLGGVGIDTVSYEDATGRVVIRISNQTAAEGEAAGDIISGFENATGGAGNDALIGDGIANTLDGRAGNDYLDGGSGNDILIGGLGDDRLVGGAGADAMNGGDGIDLADYSSATTRVVVRLSTGLGESNHAQGDTLTNIENLTGGSANDSLIGANNIANALRGGGGDDYLDGLSGNDYLDGGAGADRMNGGAGADTFAFVAGQANNDQVLDFASGQDTMRFEGYGAGATLTQLDATHWRIASANGLTVDVITLTNAANIAPGDVLFV